MCQTSRPLSWPRAQGLLTGSSEPNGAYSRLTHPASVYDAAREKWPQSERSHLNTCNFVVRLLKMLLPGAPPQGYCAGTFIHSRWGAPGLGLDTPPCSVKTENPGLRGEKSHLSSLTERPMKAKELYFCKQANDCGYNGMARL